MSQFRIGISGWTYSPWRGVFYPRGLVQKKELEYASRQLNSIEINGTFYSLQKPASYRKWVEETPDDFIFSVKGPKYITHMKKLIDVQTPLANFFASGVLLLGKKFGPILWQFPPWWHYDEEKLEQFLEMLPRTTDKAAELASEHTLKNKDGSWTGPVTNKKLEYAFEPRHPSFFTEGFIRLLRKHNAALVFADSAGKWPFAEDLTADIVYIRLHGSKELYASGYTDEELDRWASRIKLWTKGKEPEDATLISPKESKPKNERDIYVYFDNDIKVHAPFDAIHLAERLGVGPQGT
jgi:uncharacterized protein YecE (DUF72 family)